MKKTEKNQYLFSVFILFSVEWEDFRSINQFITLDSKTSALFIALKLVRANIEQPA